MRQYVKRIISQDHHRNGSGDGSPFVVTVFEPADERGRFVAMSFGSTFDEFRQHTGVVKISLLPDVEFAHGNSWRGADHYGAEIAKAWQEQCKAGFRNGGDGSALYRYDPFDESWDAYAEENASFQIGLLPDVTFAHAGIEAERYPPDTGSDPETRRLEREGAEAVKRILANQGSPS